MTVIEAINRVDECKPNTYSTGHKIAWLRKLDWMVKRLIVDTHEDSEAVAYTGYTEDDTEKELLAPEPFDEMYPKWLIAQIDLANLEYDYYNASITLFQAEWDAYESFYNGQHRPLSAGPRFAF